jgi:hypothetical protein
MANKGFGKEYGKNPGKAMWSTKQWFHCGRTAIVDRCVASVHLARGFAENDMCMIGNVTSGHSKFPRQWLFSKAKARGQRASCTSILKVENHGWEQLAAVDCDKQPMCMLGTARTTAMDLTLTRNCSILLADGTSSVQLRTKGPWSSGTSILLLDGWNAEAHKEGLRVSLQPGPEPALLFPPRQRCATKEPAL